MQLSSAFFPGLESMRKFTDLDVLEELCLPAVILSRLHNYCICGFDLVLHTLEMDFDVWTEAWAAYIRPLETSKRQPLPLSTTELV
jgi:hypothetical protein